MMITGIVMSVVLPTGGALLSVINPAELTFNGKEIRSLSEAIFEKVFDKPEKDLFHTIITGIEAKEQIGILGRLGLVGVKGTGCKPSADPDAKIGMSEKFWDPEDVEVRIEQCWDDLKKSFFVYGQQKGVKRPDLTRSDFANFLEDRLADAALEALYRITWFNDVDHDTVDASPAGLLTSGTKTKYFTILDGFWKQLFAITTADPNRRVTIAKNAEATTAAQLALGDTDAIDTFRKLIQDADKRLKNDSGKVIVCTDTLWDNWLTYKESQSMDRSFERQEMGFQTDKYRATTIINFDFWDRIIETYFNDGTKLHLPHRAVLLNKENMQIGTEEADSMSEMDSFYDRKDKDYTVDMLYKLDAKVIEDYRVQVAF